MQLQATSKAILKLCIKSRFLTAYSGLLGRLFLSATLNPLPTPSTYHPTSLLPNSKPQACSFTPTPSWYWLVKCPPPSAFLFRILFHFNEFDISFYGSLAALVLILLLSWALGIHLLYEVSRHQHSLKSFLGTLQSQSFTTIFSASSATSSRAGSFRRCQRSWKPSGQKLLFFYFKTSPTPSYSLRLRS